MTPHVSTEQLSALIDGQLSLTSREAVLDHLRACPSCAEQHERLIDIVVALQSATSAPWSEAHTARVMAALPPRPSASRIPTSSGVEKSRDWMLPIAATIAATGALAMLLATAPGRLASAGAFSALSPVSDASIVWPGHFGLALALVVILGFIALPLIRAR